MDFNIHRYSLRRTLQSSESKLAEEDISLPINNRTLQLKHESIDLTMCSSLTCQPKKYAPRKHTPPKIAPRGPYFHPEKSVHPAYCHENPYFVSKVRPQKSKYAPRSQSTPSEVKVRPQKVKVRPQKVKVRPQKVKVRPQKSKYAPKKS